MKDAPRAATAAKETPNPKLYVLEELLRITRMIRKNGSPDEAIAAAEYEKRLEKDRLQIAA